MSFANINLGTTAGDHTGDPLRTAFDKINKNFWQISNGSAGVTINSTVDSVAGRTGNVTLTVNDIPGAVTAGQVSAIIQSNLDAYANLAYVNSRVPNVSMINNMISDAIDAENIQDIRDYTSSLQTQIYTNQAGISALQTNTAQLSQRITAGNAVVVTANTAMKGYVDAQVLASANNTNGLWLANAAAQAQTLAALTANAGIQGQAISSVTDLASITASNLSAFVAPSLTAINVSIAGTPTAISSANTAMKGYVDAQIVSANTALKNYTDGQISSLTGYVNTQDSAITTAWTANAATQAGAIATLSSGQTAANAVIATKAPIASPTFTGNATAGNVFATGFFYANGTPFVSSSYNDSNVAAYLNTALPNYSGNISADHISAGNITITGNLHYGDINYDNLTISGNIIASNYLYAGTGAVNIRSNNDLNLQAAGRIYTTSVEGIVSNANITTTSFFIGDGSKLSNIVAVSTFGNTDVESWLRTGSNVIARINSNVTGSNAAIAALLSRVNSDAGNANVTFSAVNVAITTANVNMKSYVDDTRYTDANVGEVLTSYTGNLSAGNISVGTIGSPTLHAIRGNVRLGIPVLPTSLTPVIISAATGAVRAANAIVHVIGRTQGSIVSDSFGFGYTSSFTGRYSRGTASAPTAALQGDRLAQFTALGYGDTGFPIDNSYPGFNLNEAGMSIHAAEDFTDTSMGATVHLWTIPLGSNTGIAAMSLYHNGNVFIRSTRDSTSVDSGALTVAGGVGIAGNVYAGNVYVDNDLTVLGNISYTMGNASNWDSSVTNVGAALDALAALTTYAKTKEITHSANILAAPSSFGDGSSIGISDNYQTEYVSITNALGDVGRATLPNIATIGKTVIITSSAAHATQVDYYSWASAHGDATISNSTNGVAILMSLGSGKWKQLQRND